MGYKETFDNNTKYGKWLGTNELPWCAAFVSWCARQAEIPTSVIRSASVADPGYYSSPYYGFGVECKDGNNYTPQPGDLFFKRDFSHTGLVYHVEGEYFYTIEGNVNNVGHGEGTDVMVHKRKISDCYFGVYKNTDVQTPESPVVTVADEEYTTGKTIRINWEALAGAKSYEIVIYENSVKYLTAKVGSKNYYDFKSPKAGEYLISVSAKFADGKTSYGQKVVVVEPVPTLSARYNINGGKITQQYRYVVTGGDGVDFRESPYTYANKYGVIPVGTLLNASEIFENGTYIWAKVTYNGKEGWCLTSKNFCERVGYHAKSNDNIIQYPDENLTETQWGAGSGERRNLLDPQTAYMEKENHTFVGWSRIADGSGKIFRQDQMDPLAEQIYASFGAEDKIVRMYAIWRKTIQSIAVATLPDKTDYVTNDELNVTGLTLQVNYADGTSEVVDSGFRITGFDTTSTGKKTLTVSYYDAQTTFAVTVTERMKYKIEDGYAMITDFVENGPIVILPDIIDGVPVTEIGTNAFADCSRITGIVIPDSITKIGEGAFSGCSNLSMVKYAGSEEQWNEITIGNNNEPLTTATLICSYQTMGDYTGGIQIERDDAAYLLKHSMNPTRFPLAAAMANATIIEPSEEPIIEEPAVEPVEESEEPLDNI